MSSFAELPHIIAAARVSTRINGHADAERERRKTGGKNTIRRRGSMTEVLVYRVENEHLDGPYGKCYFGATHNDEKTHPSPYRDCTVEGDTLKIEFYENCGLKSMREIKQWFEGHGTRLAEKGFKLVALAVDEGYVREGRKQVVFPRWRARVIHEMDPRNFITTNTKIKD